MSDSLPTKIAFVLGGSRGIGAAIVRRLAADGAQVAFTYAVSADTAASLVAEIEGRGGVALTLQADSGEPDQIKAAVEAVAGRFGRIDILVVNAGTLMAGAVDQFAMADFDRMLAVNVRGVFAAIHYAAPHLTDGGRVITIGSNTNGYVGMAGSSVYAMTKAAVAQLVRGAARDFAARRITVNNIQPGPTETDMTAGLMDYITPRLPLGRAGKPEEIAGLVAWVAGPEAGYMSGASLTIDGAWSA